MEKSSSLTTVAKERKRPSQSLRRLLWMISVVLFLNACASFILNHFHVSYGLVGITSWVHEVALSVATGTGEGVNIVDSSYPPLLRATLQDLRCGLDSGAFTSVDLVNAYIERIAEVNSTLRCVGEINPDALAIATELDTARAAGNIRGPLHGIPILLKDNIATDDKMGTTAGSFALVGARVPDDSTVAAKLRDAGAILLGKTSMSEWASIRSYNSSDGWSARTGQTVGAYFPEQDPSGSSSGSGVASSLGLAFAALGTETCGSIISPANVHNLVGIKPTVGLTSRYLVIPVSEHQDTVGPLARTVKDAASILAVIAGRDPNDNYTSVIPFDIVPDYVAACDDSALSGARIGVPRNIFDHNNSAVMTAFDNALGLLRAAGATVVDNLTLSGHELLQGENPPEWVVNMVADMVTDLNKTYFSKLTVNPHNLTSLADLQAYTQSDPREEWPTRDTGIWDTALDLDLRNDTPEFWSRYTRQLYLAGELGITGALKNHSLDALVVPTDFAPLLPGLLGSPVVTVPLGRYPDHTPVVKTPWGNLTAIAPNLPFGISFMAERFSEEKLIGLAYAFEQRTRARDTITPYLQPKTELKDVVARRKRKAWRLWT